jgi:AcrR family transcriptional regulator
MNAVNSAKRPRKDTLETRRQMVDAAEALFAEHGVDNVTMLDIARAAGQKNRNAPQYHFGDKAGLINAVLDKHSDLISIRRKAMMDALADKGSPTLRELVEAYVLPVALHVDSTENGLAYLLINCQIRTSRSFARMFIDRATRYPEAHQLASQLVRAMTAGNQAERDAKILLIQILVFHGLAGFYALGATRQRKQFFETLCSSVEAVLEIRS